MVNIDNLMNDIEGAVRYELEGYVIKLEDICEKVRALVVPAIEQQQRDISSQNINIMEYEEKVSELLDSIDNLEGEALDRKEEDERQEVIRQFNLAGKGEVIYY